MVEAYYPDTLKEALQIRSNTAVLPYAGGTDLMVRDHHDRPFLFLGRIEELRTIEQEGDRLIIGASCTYSDLLEDPRLPQGLRKAVQGVAAPAIRNLGTIGGNICNASPAGDILPMLYAMDAELILESSSEKVTVPIGDFITGAKKTKLEDTQLLTAIEIRTDHDGFSYTKIGARKALAISKLVFAGVHQIRDGLIQNVGIAFGAVGPTVLRSRKIEREMIGHHWDDLDVEKIMGEYDELIQPIDDQRSTAAYRKKACLNLLKEYLTTSL